MNSLKQARQKEVFSLDLENQELEKRHLTLHQFDRLLLKIKEPEPLRSKMKLGFMLIYFLKNSLSVLREMKIRDVSALLKGGSIKLEMQNQKTHELEFDQEDLKYVLTHTSWIKDYIEKKSESDFVFSLTSDSSKPATLANTHRQLQLCLKKITNSQMSLGDLRGL